MFNAISFSFIGLNRQMGLKDIGIDSILFFLIYSFF
nr:MAG TPA: hypothetical protein [Caudoviricetes sp.]DAO71787.1 MAG TPA: hypothetical protein [Caudoviricetes sp.]